MQTGSVAVAVQSSPVHIHRSFEFASCQKIGMSFTSTVNQAPDTGVSSVARSLFGPLDHRSATEMAREFELQNQLNFAKRFNFDVMRGEPLPPKKMKMSPEPGHTAVNMEEAYTWTEIRKDFTQSFNSSPGTGRGLNRSYGAPLLSAAMTYYPIPSSKGTEQLSSGDEIKLAPSPTAQSSPTGSSDSDIPHHNNNYIKGKNYPRRTKRTSQINRTRSAKMSQPTLPSTTTTANRFIIRYATRVLKQAVTGRKPRRKQSITDYLKTQRIKSGGNPAGKKEKC